jgi:heme/copper-type cytochrome/quinol oxidase subunit 3
MKPRPVIDVSQLPTFTFGHRSIVWWGAIGYMVIEAAAFAVVVACYFYLRQQAPQWPLGVSPPAVLFGTINTVVLLVSLLPNHWTKKAAERLELRKVRIGMVICLLFGIAFSVLRIFEFRSLNCSWDTNAYGSVLWLILGLHTLHLLTETIDTAVLTALVFTNPVEGKSYSDVNDSAVYWYFVVLTWLPLYFVIYWLPRLH